MNYPAEIGSLIAGKECFGNRWREKKNPGTGEVLAKMAPATKELVDSALTTLVRAQPAWSARTVKDRAAILTRAATLIQERHDEIVSLVALETGRSPTQTEGEIKGAAQGGLALVKDTSLLADKKIHSANPNREVTLVRTSVGVGALFTPFNSPFVLVTGKLFPALLCGNAVVLKAHELAPYAPILAVRLFIEAGVPADLIAVLQGGADVGEMVVTDPRVQFVSFTGSSRGGASILATTAPRLTRVSIEAGGKNPMVICADADLDKALADATASITVDAGQRCASTSRLIIAHEIYEKFRERLIERFATLTGGTRESDTVGAIISEERLQSLLTAVSDVRTRGAVVTYGGERIGTKGFFMQPTILENVSPDDPLSQAELFGPIVILYRVKNLDEAIAIANNSPYRLSSAIHTQDMQKAARFAREHGAGVTRINGPTFGSESHMPFGGEGLSGNGWREPGVEALNFYSSLRQVSFDNGASIR